MDMDNIRALYNSTREEITRYRDLEWKNAIFFTTAVATIIGFRIGTIKDSCFDIYLEFVIALLTVAHLYFNCFAHKGLAINRAREAFLKEQMKELIDLDNVIGFGPISMSKRICDNFENGFLDHLLIFFLVNLLITAFGFSVLKVSGPCDGTIIATVLIFLVFGFFYLNRQMKNLDSNQKGMEGQSLNLNFC